MHSLLHDLTNLQQFGGETGQQSPMQQSTRGLLMYGLPLATPFFLGFIPAAVQLSFMTASLLGVCLTLSLKSPSVRAFLKLTPLPKPVATKIRFMDTVGKVATPAIPKQRLTPFRKIQESVKDMRPSKLAERLRGVKDGIDKGLASSNGPIASMFKPTSEAEKRKAVRERNVSAREKKRDADAAKDKERELREIRNARMRKKPS